MPRPSVPSAPPLSLYAGNCHPKRHEPNVTLNCNSPLKAKGTTTEVQNYANHSYGNITLKQATAYSSNTGYIQVAEAVGNSKIISLVKKLGIDPAKDNIEDVPVMTLGTGSISPLEMAAAYATFANGGYYRQPIAITEIDSRTGSVLYQHTDNPSQVLTEGEAAAVTDVLSGVMQGGGTGAAGALSVNQPMPARRAPPTTPPTCGSAAIPRSWRAPCGPAIPRARSPSKNTARTCWATAPTCLSLSGL